MKVSLVISTYNSTDLLNLCLRSVLRLKQMPDEVIVADDGSDHRTAELIEQLRTQAPIPIIHVWHPDRGFRLAEIRNRAFQVASYEYIISIDGDLILDPNFIKDHLQHAVPNAYLQGSRAMISPQGTQFMVNHPDQPFDPSTSKVDHRFKSIRLPRLLARMVSRAIEGHYPRDAAKGANMSFYKADLVAVNGFDNDFVGWGCEDNDLAVRLQNNGVRRHVIRQACVMYHLDHGEQHRISNSPNLPKFQAHVREQATWCENGLTKLDNSLNSISR